MTSFGMEELHEDGCARLAVAGELDLATAGALARRVRHLGANRGKLLIDLSAVEFMDSRGLRALEETISDIRRTDGELELAPVLAPAVRRLFDILKVRLSPSVP